MNLSISFAPLVPPYVLWAALAAAAVVVVLLFLARGRGAAASRARPRPHHRRAGQSLVHPGRSRPSALGRRAHRRQERKPELRRARGADRSGARGADRAPAAHSWARTAHGRSRPVGWGERWHAPVRGARPGARRCAAGAGRGRDPLTDGRVHDVPADASALGFAAPVHALVTGHAGERDRRVVLVSAPRFGIVGQQQTSRSASRTPACRADRSRCGSAAMAICSSGAPSARATRCACRCRSRMPARTSSRSKPRRSMAN